MRSGRMNGRCRGRVHIGPATRQGSAGTRNNKQMSTYFKFSHVCKDLVSILGDHAGIPCLVLDLLHSARTLDHHLRSLEFGLDLVCDLWHNDRSNSASGILSVRACRQRSSVALVIILLFFLPVLLWFRDKSRWWWKLLL